MAQDHRARQYAATHQRIYDTAMKLFDELGYDVPVGRLASAAGVSVPTFYAHFPSKDDLLMAVPTPPEVEALVASVPADRPTGERMRTMILGFVRGMPDDRRSDALTRWRLIAATPRLRYRAAEYERTTAQMVLDALTAGQPEDPSAGVVVTAHFSAYTHALLRWGESDGELPLEAVVTEALDALREL